MTIRLDTAISGSVCVLWFGNDEYIDARKDVRKPGFVRMEYVRSGQVRDVLWADYTCAPGAMLAMAKDGGRNVFRLLWELI